MSVQKEREVKIEFLYEWLGHNPGSQKVVWGSVADELIGRGVAKEIPMPKPMVHEKPIEKALEEPSINKMVEKPEKKKNFARKV
jgi:hypothetical protein